MNRTLMSMPVVSGSFSGRALTAGAGVILLAAVAFQSLDLIRETVQPVARTRLADVLPRGLEAGWTVVDEPLGATEAANASALKTLNLDDYVFRRYQRGSDSFTVYAAYWAPGRMPTRLVASHTPDRCWTESGMRCVDMRFQERYNIGARPLLPAEYRTFLPADASADGGRGSARPIHVAYWHTVEGQLYDYGRRFNAVPSPWLWWKDTLAQAAYGSREQLFVRIASERPLETWFADPAFQAVMTAVAGQGLWE